jgi:RecB family endonuclease NucS
MGTEIQTWEIIEEKLSEINTTLIENNRKEKDHLEKWLRTETRILGSDIKIIGEQVYTLSGPLNFLGIDNSGNLVIIELKRDRLLGNIKYLYKLFTAIILLLKNIWIHYE